MVRSRTVIWSQGMARPGIVMGQHRTVVRELTDDDVDWIDSTAHDSPGLGKELRAVYKECASPGDAKHKGVPWPVGRA